MRAPAPSPARHGAAFSVAAAHFLVKFLLDNLYLIVIALTSGGLLLWPLLKRGSGATAVSPLLATQAINHRNATVIDIRDEKAFAAGSLAGARNIPFATIDARAGELSRLKSRPLLVICESGQQSAKAVAAFKKQGFEEVISLAGGLGAWRTAGLPLVTAARETPKPANRDATRRTKNEQRGDRARVGKQAARGAAAAAAVAATVPVEARADPEVETSDSAVTDTADDAPTGHGAKELQKEAS